MTFFKKGKSQKSIDQFKASAMRIDQDEAINAITGGTLAYCHKGGVSIGSMSQVNTLSTFNLNTSAMNVGSLQAF